MQAASDPLLGWYHVVGFDGDAHDFYVRQLWDGKASIDVSQLSPAGLVVYGESCGWTLARGHARSGDRVAMAAYLGDEPTFENAVADFACGLRRHQLGRPPPAVRGHRGRRLVAESGV